MDEKRILSVGVEKASLGRVSARLERPDTNVEMALTPRSALTLLGEIRFDLVVIAHPQSDLVLHEFLRELRTSDSESRSAKVILLAADTNHIDLQRLKERGLEVVSREESLIGDLATKALAGDARVTISVMVRLEADLPYGKSLRICQSENLSVSGMLLRTEDTLPIDTRVSTSFVLPDGGDAIEAVARVVRLTMPGEIPGIALRFDTLNNKDLSRLENFLAKS